MRALLELFHSRRGKLPLPDHLRTLLRSPRRNRRSSNRRCGLLIPRFRPFARMEFPVVYSVAAKGFSPRAAAGLALLLGGATGNLTDRILHGAVPDFFEVLVGAYRYPAFNVAGSAITIGAILILLDVIFPAKSPFITKISR